MAQPTLGLSARFGLWTGPSLKKGKKGRQHLTCRSLCLQTPPVCARFSCMNNTLQAHPLVIAWSAVSQRSCACSVLCFCPAPGLTVYRHLEIIDRLPAMGHGGKTWPASRWRSTACMVPVTFFFSFLLFMWEELEGVCVKNAVRAIGRGAATVLSLPPP